MPENDELWMRRAIELSREGFPAPNPRVGCVLVRDGVVVGEGFHEFAGGPHAEIVALSAAGLKARGSTAYVTLEPCAHYGRTPPCARALAEAGVLRVVFASRDPNPHARGGAEILSQVGIEVTSGVLEAEAALVNERFLFAHRNKRPRVVLKAAITLDGYLARRDGTSKWITGPEARTEAHRLRAEMGAVLVGSRTAALDRAELTVRAIRVENQPLRVVLDPEGTLDPDLPAFAGSAGVDYLWGVRDPVREEQWQLPEGDEAILRALFALGVTGLLVEGGAVTHRSFLDSDLAEQIELHIAPKTFGDGCPWIASGGSLESLGWRLAEARSVGPDLLARYLRVRPN